MGGQMGGECGILRTNEISDKQFPIVLCSEHASTLQEYPLFRFDGLLYFLPPLLPPLFSKPHSPLLLERFYCVKRSFTGQ